MSITERIKNHLELDSNSVWRLPGQEKFNYSEGEYQENYLRTVFRKAKDLSSSSYELEEYIRDWPSEYHLSRKRTQLLREFSFNRGDKVLEVGCGCGAITRFLGETFDDVIAIEGNLARASLARMRTKDLPGVEIINAPFQKVGFQTKFDLIFCIGVLEYSGLFVDGAKPFEAVLAYFSEILVPGGAVVIAIENQFGLKYFNSSEEDHTDILFDGVEGYPRYDRERTFGHRELSDLLQKCFQDIQFFYPFPDYKLPTCVLSAGAFERMKLGELVGSLAPRDYGDYAKTRRPRFDQRLVLMELDRNQAIPFFSNSFLVVAGKSGREKVGFKELGVLYSDRTRKELQTVSRFSADEGGAVLVSKSLQDPSADRGIDDPLRINAYRERWMNRESIQMQLLKRAKRREITLDELFAPCEPWLRKIRSLASLEKGEMVVAGRYLDCTWGNSFVEDGGCVLIDQEWAWNRPIRLNALVVRSIYHFLHTIRNTSELNSQLARSSTRPLITRIASCLGFKIEARDFREFAALEAEFGLAVAGQSSRWKGRLGIRLMLVDRRFFLLWERMRLLRHWVKVRARFRWYRIKRPLGLTR
jgi:SAM-dependent methyltransferase